VRETSQNPFGDDEDEDVPTPTQGHSRNTSLATAQAQSSGRSTPTSFFSSGSSSAPNKKSKKDKDKKGKKGKAFDLEAEQETMKSCIAESSMASTNLLNALRVINREHEQISENKAAVHHFDFCKLLRRKILRYIQHVTNLPAAKSELWLGALLHANDELVTALMTFEQLDRSIDADSDSDDELAEQQHLYKVMSDKGAHSDATSQLAGLRISKSPIPEARPPPPPRPAQPPPEDDDEDDFEEEDENDPFADRNAVTTPRVEKSEPKWRVV